MNTPTASPKPTPLTSLSLIVLFTLIASGCVTPGGGASSSSRAAALGRVHKVYQQEFAQVAFPQPSQHPSSAPSDSNAFQGTLKAIQEFKTSYGGDNAEAAHLTVLEGMTRLQSGQIGQAKLMRDEVRQAAPRLHSGNDRYTRDELLARSFDPLLIGWEQVHHATSSSAIDPSSAKFKEAADGIEATLTGLNPRELAGSEVDAGAKYLATCSALFRVWFGNLKPSQKTAARQQGAALLARYLTPAERQAAESGDFSQLASNQVRYARWYRFLAQTP